MNTGKSMQPEFSIEAFQAGQRKAFTFVFDQYYAALCFFATRLIQDQAAAEDIAQETLIKLWEKHEGFSNAKAIKAFLYITTRNSCFNYIKRSQVGSKNHKLWSQVWDESEDYVLNQLTRSEVIREIYVILESLPPECRKVMRHSFIDGLDNHEIASRLQISIHTVKNQKARALYLIKKKLVNKPLLLLAIMLLEMRTCRTEDWKETSTQPPTAFYWNASASGIRTTLLKCASYTVWLINFFLL